MSIVSTKKARCWCSKVCWECGGANANRGFDNFDKPDYPLFAPKQCWPAALSVPLHTRASWGWSYLEKDEREQCEDTFLSATGWTITWVNNTTGSVRSVSGHILSGKLATTPTPSLRVSNKKIVKLLSQFFLKTPNVLCDIFPLQALSRVSW